VRSSLASARECSGNCPSSGSGREARGTRRRDACATSSPALGGGYWGSDLTLAAVGSREWCAKMAHLWHTGETAQWLCRPTFPPPHPLHLPPLRSGGSWRVSGGETASLSVPFWHSFGSLRAVCGTRKGVNEIATFPGAWSAGEFVSELRAQGHQTVAGDHHVAGHLLAGLFSRIAQIHGLGFAIAPAQHRRLGFVAATE
jgi:hypothetical protein